MNKQISNPLQHRTIDVNVAFFERRFTEGYGVRYPESHVIRFHIQVLKHRLSLNGGRLLDFGCGLGTHARYFADHGFDVVACDSSPTAIAKAKELHPHLADRFFVNPAVPDFTGLDGPFDIVFCHQVLAYFTNPALRHLVDRFHNLTRDNGVFFATQYPVSNGISKYVTATDGEMSEITLHGRLSGREYVNFKSTEEMVDDFLPFEKLYAGFTAMQIDDEYGGNDQLIYVGLKK